MRHRHSLPGIPIAAARTLAREIRNLPVEEAELRAATQNELTIRPVSGLPAYTEHQLRALQSTLTELARKAGYPDNASSQEARTFDLTVGHYLHTRLPGVETDLLRPETWSYVSTILVPHLVRWRFPAAKTERYAGSLVRNTLGRMWLAARTLDRGHASDDRWTFFTNASADFLVQLLERPILSADRRLALMIAEAWSNWRNSASTINLERVNRSALKQLTFQVATIEITALNIDDLRAFVHRAYYGAAEIADAR